jgi:hypothetical protein
MQASDTKDKCPDLKDLRDPRGGGVVKAGAGQGFEWTSINIPLVSTKGNPSPLAAEGL